MSEGLAFLKHHLELPSEFVGNGVAVGSAVPRWCGFDRVADQDDRMKRPMRAGIVGQVFLITFQRFEQTLRGDNIGEVVARITMQLLGEVQILELPPTARALRLGNLTLNHIRHNG